MFGICKIIIYIIFFCSGRTTANIIHEMETYEGNIGEVVLYAKATASSKSWNVLKPWHWAPIPSNREILPLSHQEDYPVELKEQQKKGLLKVYHALIPNVEDWLRVLIPFRNEHIEDFNELTRTSEEMDNQLK